MKNAAFLFGMKGRADKVPVDIETLGDSKLILLLPSVGGETYYGIKRVYENVKEEIKVERALYGPLPFCDGCAYGKVHPDCVQTAGPTMKILYCPKMRAA
jgi:hypothetical protein